MWDLLWWGIVCFNLLLLPCLHGPSMHAAGASVSSSVNLDDIFGSTPPATQQFHASHAPVLGDNLLGGLPTGNGSLQPAFDMGDDSPFDLFGGPHHGAQQQSQSRAPAVHDDLLGGFEGSLGEPVLAFLPASPACWAMPTLPGAAGTPRGTLRV